jgi:hypothetical protein
VISVFAEAHAHSKRRRLRIVGHLVVLLLWLATLVGESESLHFSARQGVATLSVAHGAFQYTYVERLDGPMPNPLDVTIRRRYQLVVPYVLHDHWLHPLPSAFQANPPSRRYQVIHASIPTGVLFIPLAVVACARRTTSAKRRRRLSAGLCPYCGYDMRGGQRRCPECGGNNMGHPGSVSTLRDA